MRLGHSLFHSFAVYNTRGLSQEDIASQGRWLEALSLACSVAAKNADKEVESTVHSVADEQDLNDIDDERERVKTLLLDYLQIVLPSLSSVTASQQLHVPIRHWSLLAGVCILFCLKLGRLQLLFGDVQERFKGTGAICYEAFLMGLEPFILSGQIKIIPAATLKALFDSAQDNEISVQRSFELCVVHLTYPSNMPNRSQLLLDISSFFLQRGSIAGFLYITATGLGDYSRAFKEGAAAVMALDVVEQDASRADGAAQLLLFLLFLFRGRSFPCGQSDRSLDGERLVEIIRNLLDLLLSSSFQILHSLFSYDAEGLYFALAEGICTLTSTARIDLTGYLSNICLSFLQFSTSADLLRSSSAETRANISARQLYFSILLPAFCVAPSASLSPSPLKVPLHFDVLLAAVTQTAENCAHGDSNNWQYVLREESRLIALLEQQLRIYEESNEASLSSNNIALLSSKLVKHGFFIANLSLPSASRLQGDDSFSAALDYYLSLQSQPASPEKAANQKRDKHPVFVYLQKQFDSLSSSQSPGVALSEAALSRIVRLHEVAVEKDFYDLIARHLTRHLTITQLIESPIKSALIQRELLTAILSYLDDLPADSPKISSEEEEKILEKMAVYQPSSILPYLKKSIRGPLAEQSVGSEGAVDKKLVALCERYRVFDAWAFVLRQFGHTDLALQVLLEGFQAVLSQAKDSINQQLKAGAVGTLALLEVLSKTDGPGASREDACARLFCHGDLLHLVECIADLAQDKGDPDLWFKAFDFLLFQRRE